MNRKTWNVPYSVGRLLRLCRMWDFSSEAYDLPDCDDGEPKMARAQRRVSEYFRQWRNRHEPDADPFFDEGVTEFHICDVAILIDECRRLWRLEEKVQLALGPPVKMMQFNKKTGKFEQYDEV